MWKNMREAQSDNKSIWRSQAPRGKRQDEDRDRRVPLSDAPFCQLTLHSQPVLVAPFARALFVLLLAVYPFSPVFVCASLADPSFRYALASFSLSTVLFAFFFLFIKEQISRRETTGPSLSLPNDRWPLGARHGETERERNLSPYTQIQTHKHTGRRRTEPKQHAKWSRCTSR